MQRVLALSSAKTSYDSTEQWWKYSSTQLFKKFRWEITLVVWSDRRSQLETRKMEHMTVLHKIFIPLPSCLLRCYNTGIRQINVVE